MNMFAFHLGRYLRAELLGWAVGVHLTWLGNCQTIFQSGCTIYILKAMGEVSSSSTCLQHLAFCLSLTWQLFQRMVLMVHFELNLHCLNTNDGKPIFMCFLAIYTSFLGGGASSNTLSISYLRCWPSYWVVKAFGILFCIHILYQRYGLHIYFLLCDSSFHSLGVF